jgi:serine/threonine-protein kinase
VNQGDLVAGRYRLLRPVGEGATGVVWAARHELLGREFALKIAANSGRAARDARDLFLREVQIVGKLRHPNIVDIADAGEVGEAGLYLAMELLEGESLAQRIAGGPLAPADALAVAREVARGLAAAHAAGVVHRDVKPENIFLARGSAGGVIPKLLDFGVSSARDVSTLHKSRLLGTPAYMSPEQALGAEDIDHRTDVWSLGVVLYEMLTGTHPFRAPSYPALLPLIIDAPYPPLPTSIPAEVRTVVAGCLAKDRADRYPSADALCAAIERAIAAMPEQEPGSTRTGFFVETGRVMPSSPAIEQPIAPPARPSRRGLAMAILAVPVVIGIAVALTGARRDRPRPAVIASTVPSATSATSAAPSAPSAAPTPSATATASAVATATTAAPKIEPSAKPSSAPATRPAAAKNAPPAGKTPVTKIDSAGF